ncbi:MAG: contractile injection system tape measure protein [Bacteroidota bacterium]
MENTSEDNPNAIDQALFITNAGLVLLAPFLGRYFSLLEMTTEDGALLPEAADRAVHLLQYLVSGRSETTEDLLVLNKVFCGLPVETPVSAGIELTEQEIEVSEFLLKSVLQNWSIMSNSSIDNLRGSFLLRAGKLVEEEDRWLLMVESAAYDIALTSLPWTFSMVMLPWMQKRVEVEWNTQIT